MINDKLNYIYQICGLKNDSNFSDFELIKSFLIDQQNKLSLSNQRRLEKIFNQLLDYKLSTEDYEFLKEIILKLDHNHQQLFTKLKTISNQSNTKKQHHQFTKIINIKIKNNKIPEVNFIDHKIIFYKKNK